jgi:Fe-S oxidoreductase
MENVILATDNCRYCLMCRHVCPVGHLTRLETLTPHGWGLTIASVRRGLLEWNADSVGVLYHCADCGTCRSHCVTDQPLPEAISTARAEVVKLGLAPEAAHEVAEKLVRWGNPYKPRSPDRAEGQGDVALFVGDEARHRWPTALEAALKLLKAVGVEPVLVGNGRNSGYLASSLGFPGIAQDLARATLDELAATGAARLLVLSPGDLFTFRQLYDERLGLAWPEGVVVQEVVELLAEALDAGMLSLRRSDDGQAYAYVDPTHTVRVEGRWWAPRRLLAAALAGEPRELFWRRERAHPSGATALQFTLPHMAMMLAAARVEDARQAGARLIVTEAPGDLAQLSRLAPKAGLRLQGLFELLAQRL